MAWAASPLLSALATTLAPHGFNLIGTAPVDGYDAGLPPTASLRRLMPEARTAVVVGNGGPSMWNAFEDFCRRRPEHSRHPDPIDRYTEIVVGEAVAAVFRDLPVRVVYPFRFATEPVSFMRLADCAGLGRPGLVGVLLHPVYGPWMALRAAILVPAALDAARPADGFDPCPTCTARSCIAACPGGAVRPSGWDVPTCAATRATDDDPCARGCHARHDCVIGRDQRYPEAGLAHHQARARAALLAFAGAR